MKKKTVNFSQGLKVTHFPEDATHFLNYEYFKHAAAPHNKKILVWRCGGWVLSSKTLLEENYKIDLNKKKTLKVENDLERVKRLIGKQSLEYLAKYYELSTYRFKQILEKNKIELPGEKKKEESLSIFG